ncbi:MAG: hypothetical protein J6X35_10495 [Bacteroidales bacterium]|nr:hypothetical protein [Bacteroidales bacterium]
MLHVGIALVGKVVMICLLGFQLAAEAGQPADQRGFDERQQGADFRIGEVILL